MEQILNSTVTINYFGIESTLHRYYTRFGFARAEADKSRGPPRNADTKKFRKRNASSRRTREDRRMLRLITGLG